MLTSREPGAACATSRSPRRIRLEGGRRGPARVGNRGRSPQLAADHVDVSVTEGGMPRLPDPAGHHRPGVTRGVGPAHGARQAGQGGRNSHSTGGQCEVHHHQLWASARAPDSGLQRPRAGAVGDGALRRSDSVDCTSGGLARARKSTPERSGGTGVHVNVKSSKDPLTVVDPRAPLRIAGPSTELDRAETGAEGLAWRCCTAPTSGLRAATVC